MTKKKKDVCVKGTWYVAGTLSGARILKVLGYTSVFNGLFFQKKEIDSEMLHGIWHCQVHTWYKLSFLLSFFPYMSL